MSSDSVLRYSFSYIDKIYNHIIALCEFDRLPGSHEYDLALDYVISELKDQNCELNVLNFPAKENYWNWTFPVGMSHWKDGRDDTKIKFYNDKNLKLLEILIPGESEKEIFFITHLCHPKPSANDNASGPAMFIELIRYFAQNKPELSLRFLFTVEYWGTVAYFSKFLDVRKNCIAGISLDMVGGDQNLAGSTMIVDEIPHHLTSNLDLFLYDHMQRLAHTGSYRMVGEPILWARTQKVFYTGGSDHYILNDSTVAIPSTCLNTYPDRFYHKPEDTPDKISKDTLNLFFSTVIHVIADFAKSLNQDKERSILLNYASIQKDLVRYLNEKIQSFEKPHLKKDSFMICHFLNLFERKAEIQNSKERIQLFHLMDQLYLRTFGISLQEKSFSEKPKFEKTYLGPLYRNQLFTIISGEERDRLLNFQSVDPLYFAKCELSINYLTLGYEINEISWLVDYHYKSNNTLLQGLTFFLDLLENYKYLKKLH
ncbi:MULTISPECIES: DUF4910 domain-containing protein [Leptospira]|uniref:Aminopeptidase n=2 Tax=Leptospira borgpetersenii serovar Hardjo-bovis TaxID=338217 RepID=Q04TN0_LEPBJ|nr:MULTISPECIES: DUF4910 domain-containing protein [Leptospira]ABJ75740.1 Aminopeptidase [Leptospira borgpetersenii serovar Hardjo-bovis str. JB197]ABJ78684.1 Aminopeptidase [Leptospira borgpetersenii serovar Hardjo-bovis str. L550]AMX57971.1 aminopeptidase [Leptospira borgpetersenii serovar Hardjo]AMX61202.1 aminopeptidase [Leptospira borgpetersenii serovar Hardjo]AMX64446.1 aminopeptidase [Leptospira borgpetersenii serovar Hardjo]